MKRFYKAVEMVRCSGQDYLGQDCSGQGWKILLDGKTVKTPSRADFLLPTEKLAQHVLLEWEAQKEIIDLSSMVFTGYANAAIDRIGPHRNTVLTEICRFMETDLLAYEADGQDALATIQQKVWQPYRSFIKQFLGVEMSVTKGVMPVKQNPDLIKKIHLFAEDLTDFELTALKEATSLLGSAALGLALVRDLQPPSVIWSACDIDRRHQASLWGRDPEAEKLADAKRNDLEIIYQFSKMI